VEDKIKSSRRNSKKFLKELFNKAKLGVTGGFIFSAKSGRDERRADADYCLVLIGPQSWGVFGIGARLYDKWRSEQSYSGRGEKTTTK